MAGGMCVLREHTSKVVSQEMELIPGDGVCEISVKERMDIANPCGS
jgi:hypothetical protein